MSKHCVNCGAESLDNATVCGNCGTPLATEKKNKLADICAKIPLLNKLQPKLQVLIAKIVMIAVPVCIVGFIALVAIVLIAVNSGPKAALKDYFKALEKTDVDGYVDLMPEQNKSYYDDDEDTLEDLVEVILKERLDDYEEDYGNNVKIKIKVTKKEDMTNIFLKEIKEDYKNDDDLKDIEIKAGAEIDFDITIKGKDDEADGDGTAYLIKEDGKWKVYTVEFDVD